MNRMSSSFRLYELVKLHACEDSHPDGAVPSTLHSRQQKVKGLESLKCLGCSLSSMALDLFSEAYSLLMGRP